MSLKKEYKQFEDFFTSPPNLNQKAWSIIHGFYHIILTYMEEKKISKADLARKLGKSRASISQMFNKTPNLSVKRMIEIAEAVGVEISISSKDIKDNKNIIIIIETEYVPIISNLSWQVMQATKKVSSRQNINYFANSSALEFCCEEVMPG